MNGLSAAPSPSLSICRVDSTPTDSLSATDSITFIHERITQHDARALSLFLSTYSAPEIIPLIGRVTSLRANNVDLIAEYACENHPDVRRFVNTPRSCPYESSSLPPLAVALQEYLITKSQSNSSEVSTDALEVINILLRFGADSSAYIPAPGHSFPFRRENIQITILKFAETRDSTVHAMMERHLTAAAEVKVGTTETAGTTGTASSS